MRTLSLCLAIGLVASLAAAEDDGLKQLRADAAAGKADAQYDLGTHFAYTDGEDLDEAQALVWYRKAAEQGHVEAQNALAFLYYTGRGTAPDRGEALKWWKLAAEAGQVDSQYWLGDAYQYGTGVPQDYVQAAKWYRLSAEQGDAHAQASMGDLYAEGLGVRKNEIEAVRWYRLAADQDIASGLLSLGEMYRDGRGVKRDERHAAELFRRAAEQDDHVAQTELAAAYASARGLAPDLVCAYMWYRIAERGGFDVYADDRAELEPRMTSAELAEAERRIAASRVEGDRLVHPLCRDETVTISVREAALADVLRTLEMLSGYRIEAPDDPDAKVTVDAPAISWEAALDAAAKSAGYSWSRDGAVIRLRRAAK